MRSYPANEMLLYTRYAEYLTLCLRAALALRLVQALGGQPPKTEIEISQRLAINPIAGRSFLNVLTSLGLLTCIENRYALTSDGRSFLDPVSDFTLAPYLALGSTTDDALQSFLKFLHDPAAGAKLYAQGSEQCLMDDGNDVGPEIAAGLASRAKRFARLLAQTVANRVSDSSATVVEIGAGSPFFALEYKLLRPETDLVLTDRANGLPTLKRIAGERGVEFGQRINAVEWNFFEAPPASIPRHVNAVVASNVLHDWNPEAIARIGTAAARLLKSRGLLFVHEGILRRDFSNPLATMRTQWMSAYGMALSRLTGGQGSCYTVEEYDAMLFPCGLKRGEGLIDTTDGCAVLVYERND